ncbi:MAG: D-glycero-beta-D-manno-heptose 1-phosphate adenylyltransferase [Leptospira sp.]|nr:D-glycero-beta-D-manno-heptose 1-phosphate adenylyltransferase [Leptospira sp.]
MRNIQEKIIHWNNISKFRESLNGKQVIFTNGCFDILHRGHVTYLVEARRLGDFLWVGINSDLSVSRLKGPNRPINSQDDRALVIASLESVDYVTIFPQDTPLELIELVKPSVHTKGGDYDIEKLPETPLVRSLGGKVVILPFVAGKSTTNTLKKLEESLAPKKLG